MLRVHCTTFAVLSGIFYGQNDWWWRKVYATRQSFFQKPISFTISWRPFLDIQKFQQDYHFTLKCILSKFGACHRTILIVPPLSYIYLKLFDCRPNNVTPARLKTVNNMDEFKLKSKSIRFLFTDGRVTWYGVVPFFEETKNPKLLLYYLLIISILLDVNLIYVKGGPYVNLNMSCQQFKGPCCFISPHNY